MNTRGFLMARFITLLIMILIAGCASASGNTEPGSAAGEPEEANITVAAIPAVDLAGLYIALADGLFARQGLHVILVKIPSSRAIITDQLRGQVDIGAGSYLPYIAAQAAGARFRILAEASALAPNTRVLVVRGDSPITTVAELAGKKIGLNGTDSIGTLLVSMLLSAHGVAPRRVAFITDPGGFPTMPQHLQQGAWAAAFLSEPYVTDAGEQYGEQVLADLDQGAAVNLPIDGYVATQSWAQQHPKTAAAFARAIEQGQAIANNDSSAVQAAMAQYDNLPTQVTAAIAQTRYPVGPVVRASIQRVVTEMVKFGVLRGPVSVGVTPQTLAEAMTGSGS